MLTNDSDLRVGLEQLGRRFENTHAQLKVQYNWIDRDVRLTFFGKCGRHINNGILGTIAFQCYFGNIEWWRENAPLVKDAEWQDAANEFATFDRMGFFRELCFVMESTIKAIQMSLDPLACNAGNTPYANVYPWLLKQLGKHKWLPLLEVLRLYRNNVHSNGVFRPDNKKDRHISYNGNDYDFVVDQGAPVPWSTVLELAEDARVFMAEVVQHPLVSVQKEFSDPAIF